MDIMQKAEHEDDVCVKDKGQVFANAHLKSRERQKGKVGKGSSWGV